VQPEGAAWVQVKLPTGTLMNVLVDEDNNIRDRRPVDQAPAETHIL